MFNKNEETNRSGAIRPGRAFRRLRRALLATVAVSLAGAGLAAPAAAYPEKPVKIIVPYPAGGFNDTLGRLMGNKLGDIFGQSFIVDNKPGAGTMIGTSQAAKSPADGHTLLVVQFPFAANPWLYKNIAYDTRKDFAPIMLAGRSPMVLVVNAESSIRSMSDLLEKARKNPGAINYGSSGPGSSNHLAMALFEGMAKISLTQVPYKGSTPMLTDLAGGQIEVAFDALPHALPFIQSGKIRPIAIGHATRSPVLPDVPTVTEAGVAGYEVSSWHGFVAPAGTPDDILATLNREMNKVLQMDDVKQVFAEQGVTPDGGSRAAFADFINGQLDLWKRVVQEAKIEAQ